MKYIFTFALIILNILNTFSQEEKKSEVNYADIKISLLTNYKSTSENEVYNDVFYAQWFYVTKEMLENKTELSLIEPFEKEIAGNELGKIVFLSNKNEFTGIKYKCETCPKFKFKILAFGKINNQKLLLNLWFTKEPKSNNHLDELAKIFMTMK